MSRPRPIAVIGLDCAESSLVFEEFRDDLPNLRGLMESGSYGVLNSCHPPITVPAWACMTSGYDAGQLGVYGFRNRKDHGYENLSLALSSSIKKPRIWDHFSAAGRNSICLGVPQTFPILKPPKGVMISSFLTPDKESPWCIPKSLAPEVDRVAEGDYIIDARNFRTNDKDWLLGEIRTMTRRRFLAADHLVTTQPWDLFWMVEMGTDRIHHGFWHYCDPTHPKFPGEDNPFRWAIRDYYKEVDSYIGRLLTKLPQDALVVVVSDHGAQPMYGGIAVNEWLIEKGYLVLHEYPTEPTPTPKLKIDWSKTRVWSEGGYYARVFFNVKGREPQGVIEADEYEQWRDRIIAEMEALPGPDGKSIGTRVHRPEDLFREQKNIPPDLITYWGMMSWRSVGTVGGREIYVPENDTGPDEANHDWSGIFISRDPLANGSGEVEGLRLLDVGVSLLAAAELPVPADTAGQPTIRWK